MLVLIANIRAFNLYVESPKLQNPHFASHMNMSFVLRISEILDETN